MPEIYRIATDSAQPCDQAIAEVGNVLSSGGLALIPTETVYGLAVAVAPFMQPGVAKGASREPSVNGMVLPPESSGYRRIFTVKQRDLAQTAPWLVGGVDDLDRYGCAVDEVTRALADAFWPGALTLIVRAHDRVPRFMQAADGTVALRCSASPVVAALIRACGCPLATTSANTHGMPAPASFDVVEPVVLAGVDAAIDAGETPCQDASTIVSCVSGEVVIARYGALSEDDIQRIAKTARMRMQDRQ